MGWGGWCYKGGGWCGGVVCVVGWGSVGVSGVLVRDVVVMEGGWVVAWVMVC